MRSPLKTHDAISKRSPGNISFWLAALSLSALFTADPADALTRFAAEISGSWSPLTENRIQLTRVATRNPSVFYERQPLDSAWRRSDDGGKTWNLLPAVPDNTEELVTDLRDENVVFFAARQLYRSDDGGLSAHVVLAGVQKLALYVE